MLLYHPAFDTYHSAFRLLLLLWNAEPGPISYARLRVLDFYLLFPSELEGMNFPKNLLKEKGRWKALRSRYNKISDPRRVFDELTSFQLSGLHILISTGLVKQDVDSEAIELMRAAISQALVSQLQEATVKRGDILKLLTGPFQNIELYGRSGLKARTGLFEYRYDPV